MDKDIQHFVESLELTDEQILAEFTLTLDGRTLTKEEGRRFLTMVRGELQKRAAAERKKSQNENSKA
ncbi:hypothetical protein YDYSY3_38750 [Paenibacillus chitinolyticus]|uniref:hypothetical protein n=1 Tax=Paenibacillus chitinolyticus TaxID=79263 RepID=UPI0026E500B8|nr:hypothetical protein [Paenibacillus chitinolyticus]GKS12875.1 hypothetical protein YDYSY3_38750 [Paenibacillus chitinolyticus]